MKRNKIIFHSIDSPRRELEWRLFTAVKLAEIGFTNVIGSKTEIQYLHEYSRNCIFLGRLNSVTGRTSADRRFLKRMEINKTSLFYLHDEGGFYFRGEYEDAVRKIYPEELFDSKAFQKVLFWGERQRNVFDNHPQKFKFAVTGSPRFDLLKPQFFSLDAKKVEKIQQKYGEFILVCTRFGAVNRVSDEPTTLSKRSFDIRVEGGALKNFNEDQILNTMFSAWEKISFEFTHFVPALAKLIQDFPEINFVIRPHPAERQSFYTDSFSHFKNVFVDKSGDVRPYIRAARTVIHSECTTGVEAEIAEKPSINFRPCMNIEKYSPFNVEGVSKVGLLCDDYTSLARSLETALSEQNSSVNSLRHITPYLVNVSSDIHSLNRIVDIINKASDSQPEISYVPAFAIRSRLQLVRYIKNKLRSLRDIILNAKALKKGDSKFYRFSNNELQGFLEGVGINDVRVEKKGANIWVSPKEPLKKTSDFRQ